MAQTHRHHRPPRSGSTPAPPPSSSEAASETGLDIETGRPGEDPVDATSIPASWHSAPHGEGGRRDRRRRGADAALDSLVALSPATSTRSRRVGRHRDRTGIGVSQGTDTARWCRSHHRSGRWPTPRRRPIPTPRLRKSRRRSPRCSRPEAHAATADDTAQQILKATALVAKDKDLLKAAGSPRRRPAAGQRPASRRRSRSMPQFEALGGYFAERVTDLRDVGARAVAVLLGVPAPGPAIHRAEHHRRRGSRSAETATLDRALVAGIITQHGGRTSHTAIPRRPDGDPGRGCSSRGHRHTGWDSGRDRRRLRCGHDRTRSGSDLRSRRRVGRCGRRPCPPPPVLERRVTGIRVALLANIGGPEDAEAAGPLDLEGVGLFRTEFVFLSASNGADRGGTGGDLSPGVRAVRRAPGRRADARRRADKPLAFADLGPEENPALGRRGPAAVGRAAGTWTASSRRSPSRAGRPGADVRVMAPMVATAEEAAWFSRRVREHGGSQSRRHDRGTRAALRSAHVLAEVDFASLGTNDLAQYTMAADRMQARCRTCSTRGSWRCSTSSRLRAICGGRRAARSECAASRPVICCSRSSLTGLGVGSCRWHRARSVSSGLAIPAHTMAGAGGSPRSPVPPGPPATPSTRCAPNQQTCSRCSIARRGPGAGRRHLPHPSVLSGLAPSGRSPCSGRARAVGIGRTAPSRLWFPRAVPPHPRLDYVKVISSASSSSSGAGVCKPLSARSRARRGW